MLTNIKKDFSRFLSAEPNRLHFAAHSHHYWPDVTLAAQTQAFDDAALYVDEKWGRNFSTLIPDVQKQIAEILKLPDPETICFSPNTHDFVVKLLSCFPTDRKIRILTTDSEFYSFRRQAERYAEEDLIELTIVPTHPFDSFVDRFIEAAKGLHDMVYFSHVFFNSGFAVTPLDEVVKSISMATPRSYIVVDGYHGFMARPTDLSKIAGRAFYLAGGYKYAMAGEGACFMHCPADFGARPRITGWFAEMDSLAAAKTGKVSYEEGGARFYGATFEPSGLYRMRAVFKWLKSRSITVDIIHDHVHKLQNELVNKIENRDINADTLVVPIGDKRRGNFLTFQTTNAEALKNMLKRKNIIVDNRGNRLRFGFGIYHDMSDIQKFLERNV